jgi:hypothetical protein
MAHDNEVKDVAITPDGHFALTAVSLRPEIQVWELTTGRRVAPPVRIGFSERTWPNTLGMTPDGRRALVGSWPMDLAAVDLDALLSPATTSTVDLALLAELATAQRIEVGDLSGLTTDQWQERWNQLHERNPGLARSVIIEAKSAVAKKQIELAAAYVARGEGYARQGRWKEAAGEFAKAYPLQPDRGTGMRLGILLARIGEADRYRAHCKALVDRFAGTTDNLDADQTLKPCCLLGPVPVGDQARLARLAEVLMSGDNSQSVYMWFNLAKGMYEYRTGRFDAAVATCRANRTRIKAEGGVDAALPAAVFAVESMALHRSGDTEGARCLLAELPKLTDEKVLVLNGGDVGNSWHDWLVAQLLYREAEALLGVKTQPTPR